MYTSQLDLLNPFRRDGSIRQDVLDLFGDFVNVPPGVPLSWLVQYAQQWRGPGGDRTALTDVSPLPGVTEDHVRKNLGRVGLVHAQAPVVLRGPGHVVIGVVPGGDVRPQVLRAGDAAEMVEANLLDGIAFLGGRPVNPKIDTIEKLADPVLGHIRAGWKPPTSLGQTETDWLPYVWDRFPVSQAGIEVEFIHALPGEDGVVRAQQQLPHLLEYLERMFRDAEHKTVVIFTINPHWGCHALMWQRLLAPYGYTVVTRAVSALRGRNDIPYLLDGVATWMHEAQEAAEAGII